MFSVLSCAREVIRRAFLGAGTERLFVVPSQPRDVSATPGDAHDAPHARFARALPVDRRTAASTIAPTATMMPAGSHTIRRMLPVRSPITATPAARMPAHSHALTCARHFLQYAVSSVCPVSALMTSSPSGTAPQHGHSYGTPYFRDDTSTIMGSPAAPWALPVWRLRVAPVRRAWARESSRRAAA